MYTPLVSVRIFEDTLRNNLRAFQKALPDLSIAPVLKSNAYGHGLVEVARVFDRDEVVPFFVIDTYAEALILRTEGIKTPLLIIGYTLPENIAHCRLRDVVFTIASIEALEYAARLYTPFICHLKVDTGMHRQGILPNELPRAFELLKISPHIRVEGIMTHLADADGADSLFTKEQIEKWNSVVRTARESLPYLRYVHCSATAGVRYADMIDANVLRLGIGLYGCADAPLSVSPALELVSRVSAVRTVKAGECIGYNATYTAPRAMRVATVPVGYAEGIDRRLSNIGTMLVRGAVCPIVGRVSMNMTTLDVTDAIQPVVTGDEVIAISANRNDKNSCEQSARQCATIPYDILVHIPATLRRTVIRGGNSFGNT